MGIQVFICILVSPRLKRALRLIFAKTITHFLLNIIEFLLIML